MHIIVTLAHSPKSYLVDGLRYREYIHFRKTVCPWLCYFQSLSRAFLPGVVS